MRLKSLVLCLFLFSAKLLFAQTDFRAGYIVKVSGDTLYGEIDYRGDFLMSRQCKFRDNENSVVDFTPEEVTTFRFIDGKCYASKELNEKTVFLEYLIKGEVNLYYLRDIMGRHYFIDKDDTRLKELPYAERIMSVQDKQLLYRSTKHFGILSHFINDAEFQTRILSIKKPESHSLIALAKDYHDKLCPEEQCTIYTKPKPPYVINPELVFGTVTILDADELDDKSFQQIGIIGHMGIPRTSEKLFFRTGVLYTDLNVDGDNFNVPLQLEYIYPKGIFRPRLAYGINYYFPSFSQSASFSIGGNIRLAERLFISAISEIELYSRMMFLPTRKVASYSIQTGVFYKFGK